MPRPHRPIFAQTIIFYICLMMAGSTLGWIELTAEILTQAKHKYGEQAQRRLIRWQNLLTSAKNLPEKDKLKQVNDFFNLNALFIDDIIHWKTEDYWATPLEFLATGAGDCEDFAIAKYFTLQELGVDESKMRITYVKSLRLNQPHMVLTFFASPKSVPEVLDNLTPEIKPATQRSDLLPVYSFNGTGLWTAKARTAGNRVGSSNRLSLWTELQDRMLKNPF
ncbi:transglutaminase-like cysteine peptidase [Methylomicrobium lacus]|uniref:transglutaminase-like cysteine peptidase n=1 Tax=Methylomicrobium lacus TaxID=136992 RepID=UPI0035A976A6